MSSGEKWANDVPSRPGRPLFPAASLLVLALAAILTLTLTGCRPPSVKAPTPIGGTQPTVATPVTGPQPQPPDTAPPAVTTVVPSAVRVKP